MIKSKVLLLFCITNFLFILILGCNKNPECCSPIIMELVKDKDTAYVGVETDITFDIKLKPDLVIGSYATMLVIKEGNITLDSVGFFNKTEVVYKYIYEVKSTDIERDVELSIIIYDNNNKFSIEYTNFVIVKYPPPSISTRSNMLFFSSTSLNYSMMLIFSDTSCYVVDANNNNADLAFIWQTEYGYTIASPDAKTISSIYEDNSIFYNITNKNHTSIMPFIGDLTDIDELSLNEIQITESTLRRLGSGVEQLLVGDRIAFKTQKGIKGIMEVTYNSKINKTLYFKVIFQNSAYLY